MTGRRALPRLPPWSHPQKKERKSEREERDISVKEREEEEDTHVAEAD
jgi:hypothetical protein